ncbi:hypothetical protein CP082626L3_0056B, partial [Chlamydia psittaci 08-2626_L3]
KRAKTTLPEAYFSTSLGSPKSFEREKRFDLTTNSPNSAMFG